MFKIKLLFFLLPISICSQNIVGKIYDNESTAKGIQILNITQNIVTFTNEDGDFSMKASVNDSLKFTSTFHLEKIIKVSEEHFNYKLVVELQKRVNELDEVLISEDKTLETFNPIKYEQEVSWGLEQDRKFNAHLYKPTPTGGFDVLALTKEIVKAIKNTPPKAGPIKTISYKTLDSLFSKDKFFDKKLLKYDLHISEELKPLFFEYCDEQRLPLKLLEKDKQFFLLDSLINYSKAFKTVINESKNE